MSGTGAGRRGAFAGSRRARGLALTLLLVGILAWGGRAWWAGRRRAREMAAIEAEIVAGRSAVACRDLRRLLSWRADPDGEIIYLLGSCELARGRSQAADAAWARVPPGSSFSVAAIRGRLRLLEDAGRLADAERLIDDAAEDPRHDRSALRVLLAPMFRQLGRIEEAGRLIEERWERLNARGEGALEPAIRLVRGHIELTWEAAPVEEVRRYLDTAAGRAPEDDRAWLGRANLAIRTGHRDEAKRWLDACLRRRPGDLPVWRARLSWGLAAGRIDAVQEALAILPAAGATPAEIHRLKAWLSSHRGDVESERRELERLLEWDPADRAALVRLSQLADEGRQSARAAELRGKVAGIDRLRARYEQLYSRGQPSRDAVEMAGLAERLGRAFEARGFLALAISEDPEREDLRRDLARMSRHPPRAAGRGRTLADVLASQPGSPGAPS